MVMVKEIYFSSSFHLLRLFFPLLPLSVSIILRWSQSKCDWSPLLKDVSYSDDLFSSHFLFFSLQYSSPKPTISNGSKQQLPQSKIELSYTDQPFFSPFQFWLAPFQRNISTKL